MTRRLPAQLFVLALVAPAAAAAQPAASPEIPVNVSTAGRQQAPAVDTDAAGNFVVAWKTGEEGRSVVARRFSATGQPLGGEIAVYTSTTGATTFPAFPPSVAVRPDGEFVVAWVDQAVQARRFDAAGQPLGGTIEVAPGPFPQTVDVAIDADGDFVVVWDSNGEVWVRLYAADGTPLGAAAAVADSPFQRARPAVARNDAGRFVVAWQSVEQDFPCQAPDGDCFGEEFGAFARVYAADGQPLTGELQANTQIRGNQAAPDVGMAADGSFVVVWEYFSGPWNVYGQRFDAAGNRIGGEMLLNSAAGKQAVEVAVRDDGGFVAASYALGPTQEDLDVFARRFDAAGQPLEADFRVNAFTAGRQYAHAVAATDSGFVAAWSSFGQDGSEDGIFMRLFGGEGPTAAAPVDFGGNGDTDVAIFRPSQGRWAADFDFQPSVEMNVVYGQSGDVPVPKDWNGDGFTDLAVFRPATGNWFLDFDRNGGSNFRMTYGRGGDVPVPGDYDGNGTVDLAVFRPASSTWFVDLNRNGGTDLQRMLGGAGQIPVPGDYDGDGRTDMAVFGAGRWRIDLGSNGSVDLDVVYGRAGDVPIPGDYDGDGATDLAVFRPQGAGWFIDTNRNGGSDLRVAYGFGSDIPVPGDFDGDGGWDLAVYRPSSGRWFVDVNGNGGSDFAVTFGAPSDRPLRENGWILDALGVTD